MTRDDLILKYISLANKMAGIYTRQLKNYKTQLQSAAIVGVCKGVDHILANDCDNPDGVVAQYIRRALIEERGECFMVKIPRSSFRRHGKTINCCPLNRDFECPPSSELEMLEIIEEAKLEPCELKLLLLLLAGHERKDILKLGYSKSTFYRRFGSLREKILKVMEQ